MCSVAAPKQIKNEAALACARFDPIGKMAVDVETRELRSRGSIAKRRPQQLAK